MSAIDTLTAEHLKLWDDIFRARGWGRYPPEELVRFIARTFFKAPDRKVVRLLEVGCGPGANVWMMAREGFSVSAIDGSSAAIEQLCARLETEGIEFDPQEMKVGNFARLPWPDATFDAVIDMEGLSANLMPVIRQTIAEIHRVLKPGGILFSKMFGPQCTGAGTGVQLEPNTSAEPEGPLAGIGSVHFFTPDELDDLFAAFSSVQREWLHRSYGPDAELFEWLSSARK